MLPPGITAHAAEAGGHAPLGALHPGRQMVAQLLVGACSCDLVKDRVLDRTADERDLRARYSALGLARDAVIRELERHRRSVGPLRPPDHWRHALAAFVAEHARNAGPSLYYLQFAPVPGSGPPQPGPIRTIGLADVTRNPAGWLEESVPLLVVR